MLTLLKMLIIQWLLIISSCLGTLFASHKIAAENNVWDRIKPEKPVAETPAEEITPAPTANTVEIPSNSTDAPDEPTAEAAPEPPTVKPEQSIVEQEEAKPLIAPTPPEEPEPVEAVKPQAQKTQQTFTCPSPSEVGDNVFQGEWEGNNGIRFWVDFVTRPMYENDKVTKLEKVNSMGLHIQCHYLINDLSEINLMLKSTHANGLKPTGDNWEACQGIACEMTCSASACLFEIIK